MECKQHNTSSSSLQASSSSEVGNNLMGLGQICKVSEKSFLLAVLCPLGLKIKSGETRRKTVKKKPPPRGKIRSGANHLHKGQKANASATFGGTPIRQACLGLHTLVLGRVKNLCPEWRGSAISAPGEPTAPSGALCLHSHRVRIPTLPGTGPGLQ